MRERFQARGGIAEGTAPLIRQVLQGALAMRRNKRPAFHRTHPPADPDRRQVIEEGFDHPRIRRLDAAVAEVKTVGVPRLFQELLRLLKQAGFKLVIVTNQSGIGRGYFGECEFWAVQKEFERQAGGDLIDATYFCTDTPESASERRKPNPGMLLEAANDLGIDVPESYMIGDKLTDIEAGIRAGVKASILVSLDAPESPPTSEETIVVRDLRQAAEIILAGQSRLVWGGKRARRR